MEDFESMPAFEMIARRKAAETQIATALGRIVFSYSRFVSALHLCVAWRVNSKDLDRHQEIASDLGAADLLKLIEKRVRVLYEPGTIEFKKYKKWLGQANEHRTTRNTIFHSRWGIEAYGRHALAVSTPVLVTPIEEHVFTLGDLNAHCETSGRLADELSNLRKAHPL